MPGIISRQQGLGLAHGFVNALAFGIRDKPEATIRSLLEPFRDDPQYDNLVVRMTCYRLPNQPPAAFRFIAKHAAGDWQSVMVDETIRWLKGQDARAESFAQALPTIDLSQVDSKRLAAAAQLLVQRLSDKGQLQQALNWTLKLPPASAPLARAEATAQLDISKPAQRASLTNWIQTAAISADEREALVQILNRRMEGAPNAN